MGGGQPRFQGLSSAKPGKMPWERGWVERALSLKILLLKQLYKVTYAHHCLSYKYKNDFLQIYSKINIRIVLVAMEFWNNGDKIVRSEIAGEYYDRFAKYRKNTLMKTFPDHDNAQLMW